MANTPNRNYPLVAGGNQLQSDVLKLIALATMLDMDVQALFSALSGKADLAGAAFTTSPTGPTPTAGDDSNKFATTSFVKTAFANFIGAAPAILDTWLEVVTHIQNDESALAALTSVVGNKANSADVYTKTQMDALLAAPWSFIPIGMKVPLSDNLAGVVAPPKDQSYRFIKLTAGLTGVGAYNNGVLGSESVSGTAPLVQATAVVTLASSPMNGQTVQLINTERRHLRAYDTAGIVMDDAQQGHKHNSAGNRIGTTFSSGASNLKGWNSENGPDPSDPTSGPISDGTNGTPRIANENRVKFIGETYFMRIK